MMLARLALCAVAVAAGACAVARPENRPCLSWLDARVPVPESAGGKIAVGVAVAPVAIPAGIIDTFVANPALQVGKARTDTYNIVWKDPEGSAFYRAALLVPKLVATPFVFLGDWFFHCCWPGMGSDAPPEAGA